MTERVDRYVRVTQPDHPLWGVLRIIHQLAVLGWVDDIREVAVSTLWGLGCAGERAVDIEGVQDRIAIARPDWPRIEIR